MTSPLCLKSFVSIIQQQSLSASDSVSGHASWSGFSEKTSRDRRNSSVQLLSAKAMTHLCENVTLILTAAVLVYLLALCTCLRETVVSFCVCVSVCLLPR